MVLVKIDNSAFAKSHKSFLFEIFILIYRDIVVATIKSCGKNLSAIPHSIASFQRLQTIKCFFSFVADDESMRVARCIDIDVCSMSKKNDELRCNGGRYLFLFFLLTRGDIALIVLDKRSFVFTDTHRKCA